MTRALPCILQRIQRQIRYGLFPHPAFANRSKNFNGYGPRDYDGLAAGKYPQYELFERIKVDLSKPLAEWLQDDSTQMWTSFHQNTPDKDQSLFPVQQSFSFAVQVNAGIEAKYALVSTRWSPFAPDLTAAVQQTGTLSFDLK